MVTAGQIAQLGRMAYAQMDAFCEPVTLQERLGDGSFADRGPVPAFVSAFRREELIPGGPIEQGDLKAIISRANWPAGLRRLTRGDRVTWRGEIYAVVNQDDATRTAAAEQLGVNLQLRGGAG